MMKKDTKCFKKMIKLKILFTLCLSCYVLNAQNTMGNKLPYAEIPNYAPNYSEGALMARLVDGLGFRYYWATEGLLQKDLNYKITKEARSNFETIGHIYHLSALILSTAQEIPFEAPETNNLTFQEMREKTLLNLKEASNIFVTTKDFSKKNVVFKGKDQNTIFPFWNAINGPIADAIWHCGQIVALRRASGNPINPKVSVFTGTLRN